MLVVPVNANSVRVPMYSTLCLKAKFDSTYPTRLNGIISQDEFRESIDNINRTISSNTLLMICTAISALCLIGGMALFVAGGITAVTSRTYGFPVLVGVGFGVFAFGMIFCTCGCIILQLRRMTRLRKAIAEESKKYSNRSPTPCSWRLHATRTWSGNYGGGNQSQLVYHLVIDIGRNGDPGSGDFNYDQVAFQPASSFQRQDFNRPPAYPGQPASGFCPQCGMPRLDPMAKFCASCGLSFNKY